MKYRQFSRKLSDSSIDLALVYFDGRHSALSPCYVRYLIGCKPVGETALITYPDNEPILITSVEMDVLRLSRQSGIKAVYAQDMAVACVDLVKTIQPGILLVCGGEDMPLRFKEALESCVLGNCTWDNKPVEDIALGNFEEEKENFEKSAQIALEGFTELERNVAVGVRDYIPAAHAERVMYRSGSEENFIMLSASDHNRLLHPPLDRAFKEGDIVLTELGPSINGCFVQICRTITIGEPSKAVQRNYKLMTDAFESALKFVKPGVPSSEICREIDRVMTKAGFGDYCKPPYMRVRGHTFHPGHSNPGNLTVDNTKILTEGNVIVIHPNQYFPDSGYLLYGEAVMVGADGPVLLSGFDGRLRSI
jgi:Xaa-Pro dipeptidase